MPGNWTTTLSVFFPKPPVRLRAALAGVTDMLANMRVFTAVRAALALSGSTAVSASVFNRIRASTAFAGSTTGATNATITVSPYLPTADIHVDWRFLEVAGQKTPNYAGVAPGDTPPTCLNLIPLARQPLGTFALNSGRGWISGYTLTPSASHSFYNNTPRYPDSSSFYTDAFGGNTARRIAGSTLSALQIVANFPLGNKTLSCYIKSNTGVDQVVAFGGTAPGNDITVTSTWQRFSVTDTALGAAAVFYSRTEANDILICGLQYEVGSVATAYDPGVGIVIYSGEPPRNSKGIEMVTSPENYYGRAELDWVDNSAMSIHALIKWNAGTEAVSPTLAHIVGDSWGEFALAASGGVGTGGGVGKVHPTVHLNGLTLEAPVCRLKDGRWHVLSATSDGATAKLFLDGVKIASKAGAHTVTIKTLGFGGDIQAFPGTLAYVALYRATQSEAAVAGVFSRFQSIATERAISLLAFDKRLVVAEGDSITWLSNSFAFKVRTDYEATNAERWINVMAVNGSKVAGLLSRASEVDALYVAQMRPVVAVMIGINDINDPANPSTATIFGGIKSYCQARQAAGWKVVVCTILPCTTSGANAERNTINTSIRGDTSFYDVLCDFDATAMGADADASDAGKYYDGLHPTESGYGILKPAYAAALEAALAL
jgi:lysophospholipase L1-like esterase